MMYPTKSWKTQRRGYLFNQKTFYSPHHLGLDVIDKSGTVIYAWQDLTVTKYSYGIEGGNTIEVKCKNNPYLFRLMHLLHHVKPGNYKEGAVLAQIGNTGTKTTGSHLHIDISKNGKVELNNLNNFLDPEKYFSSLKITH